MSVKLLDTFRVSIPEALHERVLAIENEDFSGVRRKVIEHFEERGVKPPTEEELDAGILALKQYYAVALLDPANAHAVTRPIDPYWHAHILHTRQYVAFCDQVVGEYMHHQPLDHAKVDDVAMVRRLYGYTKKVLPQIFAHIDDRFWPEAASDAELICFHAGNADIYTAIQPHRLFEPCEQGVAA